MILDEKEYSELGLKRQERFSARMIRELNDGLARLASAIESLKDRSPPQVTVQSATPSIRVDSPGVTVLPDSATEWEFTPERDGYGRIVKITAKAIK